MPKSYRWGVRGGARVYGVGPCVYGNPSPLRTNWVFDVIGTWLGKGLGGFGTRA